MAFYEYRTNTCVLSHPPPDTDTKETCIMNIMVYCKTTDSPSKAIDIAVKHAKAFDGTIDLVAAIEDRADIPEEVIQKSETQLKEMAAGIAREHDLTCTPQLLVTTLSAGEALIQYAEKNQVDEIIMGLRKRSKVGKLFFGSTTQYLILEAPCQVITIRDI